MEQTQTPKQQAVELVRQAQRILLVAGRNPNNDQIASMVALQAALTKLGKQVQAVVTDKLPRAEKVLDCSQIARSVTGVRDFVMSLDLKNGEVDKLKYNIENNQLHVIITPQTGNFEAKDAHFSYGAFQFDLVVAIGVPAFARIDRLVDDNPTIFDGMHIVNVDYHRINENWGSVNLIDQMASCTSEMMVSLLESLEQNIIDEPIATALLTGIMAATNRFTGGNTTPKALTVSAQLMAAGAAQQKIVQALYEEGSREKQPEKSETNHGEEVKKKPKAINQVHDQATNQQKKTPNSQTITTQPKAQDRSKDESVHEPKDEFAEQLDHVATASV